MTKAPLDKKIYDTQAAMEKIPTYRQLAEDEPVKAVIDNLLNTLDYTDIDSIMQFGSATANELNEKLKQNYSDAASQDYTSARISEIVTSKFESIDGSKLTGILKGGDLLAGKAYRKTETVWGKVKGFLGGETPMAKVTREAREAIVEVALAVEKQNSQLDEKIMLASEVSSAIDENMHIHNQLGSHYFLHYVAVEEARLRLAEDEEMQTQTDPQTLGMLNTLLTQKANRTAENLLSTAVTQRIATTTSQSLKLSSFALSEFKETGAALVGSQLQLAKLTLDAGAIARLANEVGESKIKVLEVMTKSSNNILVSSIQAVTQDNSQRYLAANVSATEAMTKAQQSLVAYCEQSTIGHASMLQKSNDNGIQARALPGTTTKNIAPSQS